MEPDMEMAIRLAFEQAIQLAEGYAGATSPNPCVGAAALDRHGRILSVRAHERAGEAHAEARLIADLRESGRLPEAFTLVVTLEPCNHQGRTPPCTDAILQAGFRQVIYGTQDPNPHVGGGGAGRLREAGIEVLGAEPLISARCKELIRGFAHWTRTGLPWVTLKTALDRKGSMIPPKGQKTFTSPSSLRLAHELRKRSDAILTGSGTILADQPEFTVRHVADHPGKSRWLAILDRRGRVSESAINRAKEAGFKVHLGQDLAETLRFLGSQGVLEVLVEAGPTLSQSIIQGGFWNQHVLIKQGPANPARDLPVGADDEIEVRFSEA